MLFINMKRCLSLVLALAIASTYIPRYATAEEEISSVPTECEIVENVSNFDNIEAIVTPDVSSGNHTSSLLIEIQEKMDQILLKYLGATMLSQEQISGIVDAMYWDTKETALAEIDALQAAYPHLTLQEKRLLQDHYTGMDTIVFFYEYVILSMTPTTFDTLSSVEPIDSQILISGEWTKSSNFNATPTASLKLDNGTVTAKAKGTGGLFGAGAAYVTLTLTVKNTTSEEAVLSFKWNYKSVNTMTIAGTSYESLSSPFSKTLGANESFQIVITTGSNGTENTLTMSDFSLISTSSNANVTVLFEDTMGEVTADGNELASGVAYEASGGSVELVAKEKSGYTFVGWASTSNELITSDKTYAVPLESDASIKAVFASKAWFLVNGKHMYDDLNAATSRTDANTVVLMNSGILSTGNYIIPQNVTLLIPFDVGYTIITDNMKSHVATSDDPKTLFRQLTMLPGANIVVNGTLCVGSRASRQMVGQVGPYGAIVMDEGSSISIENGASLYAYGYIFAGTDGAGTITVKDGGTVYEDIMSLDYPGSLSSTIDLFNDYKIFPLRAFSIRNVEVPMTLNSGAKEYVFYCIYSGTFNKNFPGTELVISSDSSSPFQLKEGTTLTKSYSGGKQYVKINGSGGLNPLSVTLQGTTISSEDTTGFPIPSGFDIELASGTITMGGHVIMTEGSKITIGSEATVETNGKNLYVLDATEDAGAVSKTDVHKTQYTQVNSDAVLDVNGVLNAGATFYTSTSGACITSSKGGGKINIATAPADTKVYVKMSTSSQKNIEVTSAQLLNSKGGYVTTAEKGPGTYTYINGFWHKGTSCDGGTATCTKKAVCSTCGLQYGDFGDHSFEQGICSVCGQYMRVEITATNIAVNDGLDMWFYVRANNVNAASYKAVVTKHFADDRSPNPIVVTIPSGQWERYTEESTGIEYLRFCFSDISAKEMTDSVEAAIFHTDGTQVSNNYSQTVQNYAITTLKNYKDNSSVKAEALKHALVDMLEYGASAQTQFAYNTAVPANVHAELSDFSGYLTTATPNCTNQKNYGNNVAGVTVSATNTLMFTFYFKVADPDGMYAIIEYTPSGETVEKTVRVESKDFYERIAGSLYGVDVKELSIVDGRALMTCTLYNSDGTVVTTATDSIEGYAYRNAGKGKIFMDMMRFVDSAFTYFTAN